MIRKTARFVFVVFALSMFVGCNTDKARRKQLERVAKDWCMTIRASQVMPVYPLTEDLRPGDIFLVQTRLEDQVKSWEKKGFLPLDQHFARIRPDNFTEFYKQTEINQNTFTPFHMNTGTSADVLTNIINAPGAGFPAYNFSVKKGGALKLAIPISGVPAAMNAIGSGSAHGSVNISKAHSYGVDINSLFQQVLKWGQTNQAVLASFAVSQSDAARGQQSYLRVVSRVYMAQEIDVSLRSDKSGGASASGGASETANIVPSGTNATENLTNTIAALNSTTSTNMKPGGAGTFAFAAGRGVSMKETFPHPLAIGYLGFDVPILADGSLGAPVPTQARLSKKTINKGDDEAVQKMAAALNNTRKSDAERIVAYVVNTSGFVDVEKLKKLLSEAGQNAIDAGKYEGKTRVVLLGDLKGRYSANVSAIAQKLPNQ